MDRRRRRVTRDGRAALTEVAECALLFRPTIAGSEEGPAGERWVEVRAEDEDAKRRRAGHPADSARGRNLNQLQPLLDPSHAAIEIVQTHGQTDVIAMHSGYLALEHRFTAREDRFSAMEEHFPVQDERMSAMLAMIVRVAERLDGTPPPPSG